MRPCGNVGPTMACGRKHDHQRKACNGKFTAAFGTPLKGTHLPMRTWFTGLYLLAVSSKGLSGVALGRHLGVGQKTAWFLGERIRAMMRRRARRSESRGMPSGLFRCRSLSRQLRHMVVTMKVSNPNSARVQREEFNA
jgi:hypothetical protein